MNTGIEKIGVLLGGRSAEREVSLKSGRAVLDALKTQQLNAYAFDPGTQDLVDLFQQKFTRVFIALHGRFGEDGTIQGMLDLMHLPYTGSGVMASALAMDKWRTKLVWQAADISTPPYRLLNAHSDFQQVVADLGLPLMVKPVNEGSSIGMTKVVNAEELPAAYQRAKEFDPMVLAEQFISGMELTVGILGETALPVIRLETPRVFYDYEAKYLSDSTRYHCPCGLDLVQEQTIQSLALRAFRILGCRGWGRVDLMLDEQGKPYFLEANTSPGMTDHSLVPMAARQAGLSFEALVRKIIDSAKVGL